MGPSPELSHNFSRNPSKDQRRSQSIEGSLGSERGSEGPRGKMKDANADPKKSLKCKNDFDLDFVRL